MGGGLFGAVIIGCVVYGIQLGWVCVVSELVCLTSSGFSSGLGSVGVFLASFPLCVCVCVYVWCVCVCVRVCARALLGAFGVSTGEKKHFNILTNLKECREGKLIWRVSLF